MSFINEILSFFEMPQEFSKFKITMLGQNAVYVEGVKCVKSFALDKIELRLNNKDLEIIGEELCIKKFCLGDVGVTGKIQTLSLK